MTTPPPSSDDYQHPQTDRGMDFGCAPLPARGRGGERGQSTEEQPGGWLDAIAEELLRVSAAR